MTSKKTDCVHAGQRDGRILPQIDLSTISPIRDLSSAIDDISKLNAGEQSVHSSIYSRLHNDTVFCFEAALAKVEEAEAVVSFSSGMAAITALILDAVNRGGHIIGCRPIYGGTDSLLTANYLSANVTWCHPVEVSQHIQHNTALIMIETPANPTCTLTDIKAVAQEANGIPLSVDSTFATPYLQHPLALGAQFSIHSATKFIGGHSDVLAGAIACREEDAKRLRKIRLMTGATLHPLSAYMLHRGLQTLHLRVEAAQQNAMRLAERLRAHPAIERLYYPDAKDPLIGTQMLGTGSMMAFTLKGGFEAAQSLMGAVQLITPAVSLGSVESLIQHPAGLTHRNVSEASKLDGGISDALIRFSVGVEEGEDLWTDLNQALNKVIRSLAAT